jgi:hypothetical protein
VPRSASSPTWSPKTTGRRARCGGTGARAGLLPAARLSLQAAVTDLEPIASTHPSAFNERRLGRARIELALTLASLGAAEQELIPIVAAANQWLRKVHSPSRELDELVQRQHRRYEVIR